MFLGRIWDPQKPCVLSYALDLSQPIITQPFFTKSSLDLSVVNVISLHRVGYSKCVYKLMDLNSSSLQNTLMVVNATIDLSSTLYGNDLCSQVYVSLFSGSGQLNNDTVVGTVNIVNVNSSTNVNTFTLSQLLGDSDGFNGSNVSSNL